MGGVYLAQHTRLLRKVAIKLLSTSVHNSHLSKRFFTEALIASALNHPNMITV
jgi:serine/threonine protein kinase